MKIRAASLFRQAIAIAIAVAIAGSGSASAADAMDPRRAALIEARASYQALSDAGGWNMTPDGPALRLGDEGPGVAPLRARLAFEGFTCGGEGDPFVFDANLDCAVRMFQERRGLETDGVVGPDTRGALNVTAASRLRQIDVNLHRWEDLPEIWPDERIEVNTAAAEATLYRAGVPVLNMRIIVGRPSTPTPDFTAEVRGVILNPSWNVPESIARNEILPRAAREPGYLAAHHYVREGGRLVQLPGPDNALGLVKLDMPNPHTVYLHDTPARALFDTARRYYSHGCMRMEKPREIAAALLQDRGWTPDALDTAIAEGVTRTVPLTRPVPVYVYHLTAYVRADGALVLQPDVYGRDAGAQAVADGAESDCAAAAPERLPG